MNERHLQLHLQENVQGAHHAQTQDHATPEQHVVENGSITDPRAALNQDNRHLQHHGDKAIATELACDAAHDQLMRYTGHQEGDEGGHGTRHGIARSRVDMTAEEVVDRNVPLA